MAAGCHAAPGISLDRESRVRRELLVGRQLLEQRQYPGAERAFEKALKIDSDSATAHAGLALVRELAGDLDGAIEHYSEAMKAAPNRSDHAVSLGNALRKSATEQKDRAKVIEAAERAYQHALALDPNCHGAVIGMGMCHRMRGRIDPAIEAYRRAERIDPSSPLPHVMLGSLYQSLSRNEEAMAEYRSALRLDPNNPKLHNALASLNESMHERDDCREALARQRALAHYRKSLQIAPDQPDVQERILALERADELEVTALATPVE